MNTQLPHAESERLETEADVMAANRKAMASYALFHQAYLIELGWRDDGPPNMRSNPDYSPELEQKRFQFVKDLMQLGYQHLLAYGGK